MMKKQYLVGLLVISMTLFAGCKNTAVKEPMVSDNSISTNQVENEPIQESEVEEQNTEEKTQELTGENLIPNGDFSAGIGGFLTYLEGGDGFLQVNDKGELETVINRVGEVDYGVQAFLDGFGLEEGCKYKMEFDISSDIQRDVEFRIQINGGDYHPYVSQVISIAPEMLHFEQEFTMSEATDPAPRLCFNMGNRGGSEQTTAHTVTIDNIKLVLIDNSNKVSADNEVSNMKMYGNQLGYLPTAYKKIVLKEELASKKYQIIDSKTQEVVLEGTVPDAKMHTGSNMKFSEVVFTQISNPGNYELVVENEKYPIIVEKQVYDGIRQDVFRMFYLQRCGIELGSETANDFAHPACHNTMAVIYNTKDKIDVSGGWHDAGDYGRYVVPGAKAVADLLLAYESNPKAFGDNTGILESNNKKADLLDEAKVELDWMLKMQNTSGGVYHKVTCNNFPGVILPQDEKEELVVSPVSTCATADFAAVMAMAGRLYRDYDANYAATCLSASQKAMQYLEANSSNGGFKNPQGIVTGEYGDSNDLDERFWALSELYKTTLDKKYSTMLYKIDPNTVAKGLGWDGVGTYGIYACLTTKDLDAKYYEKNKKLLESEANRISEISNQDIFGSSVPDNYGWGSNMIIANNGMTLLLADKVFNNKVYRAEAQKQLNYLLGSNANGYCFVTGYGSMSPKSTHHRPSQFLKKTMPGMLVGGPNANLEDPYAQSVLKGKAPAVCYVDHEQSYSCNEITIYWNSPLYYLLNEIR